MKLQNLTVIFIIIMLPIILLVSLYINTGLRTIRYQALYDTGLLTATQDAIQAFEMNTLKNKYSDNAEMKRSIIKASINMFETSLCDTCNISSYNKDDIEEYIPAIVFGLSDGFYMYAPSYNPDSGKYEHSLKNYVYYSEMLNEENAVVIRYYLDSYVQVSGYFNGTYESQEGYLINTDKTEFRNKSGSEISAEEFYNNYQQALNDSDNTTMPSGTITYYGTSIDIADELAVNYFVDNYEFSDWFNDKVLTDEIKTAHSYLEIRADNDPEDPNSDFVQNKNKVIKEKIEGVLNSSITAYSKRTWGQNYKMPKLSEEDWQKIYSDVSVTTFFQGKKIGLTKYNGYCVLNSNNHYELINPNLLYFSTDDGGKDTGINDADKAINTTYDYYHDIRCGKIKNLTNMEITQDGRESIKTIRGWKIGRFQKKTIENIDEEGEKTQVYKYERNECACYECINGSISKGIALYDYINVATSDWNEEGHASEFVTRSYWTSLARERGRLHEYKHIPSDITITKEVKGTHEIDGKQYVINGGVATYTITVTNNAAKTEYDMKISDKVSDSDEMEFIKFTERKKDSIGDVDDFEFDKNFDLKSGETITIRYEAKITDKNDNGQVDNKATVFYEGDNSKFDEETCYTVNSNLDVNKEVIPEGKVLYGGKVKYTITITNNAPITDKIKITDAFFENEIKNIKIISISSSVPGRSLEVPYPESGEEKLNGKIIGDTKIEWNNIEIVSNETITIVFEANLEGTIGNDIVNTVIVKSAYTGEDAWVAKSATTTLERKVDIKKMVTVSNRNIWLVLDTSDSMRGSIDTLNTTVNEFMKTVVQTGRGNVNKVFIFGKNVKDKDIYEKSEVIDGKQIEYGQVDIDRDDVTYGTRYDLAVDKVYETINANPTSENNPDIIIFFSDGAPTPLGELGAGITIFPDEPIEDAIYGYWNGDGNIIDQLDKLATRGIVIHTVGFDTTFGADSLEKALGIMPRNNGIFVEVENVESIFNSILPEISQEVDLDDEYTTERGIFIVQYTDRIDRIEIGGSSKDDSGKEYTEKIVDAPDLSTSDNKKGTLDLTGISGDKGIVIYYK